MNELVDFSDVRYAVIEGLHTETGHERIVLAYRNEQSLRDLIVAPSIVAFGFLSREEAVAGSRAPSPTAVACQRMPETKADGEAKRHQQKLRWRRRVETGSVLWGLGRFLVSSCSGVVTSATVTLSSSSFVSTTIRMALGSSV